MPRTLLLGALAAIVIAWSWLRLESGSLTRELLAWLLVAGIGPALVPVRALRALAALVAAAGILRYALGSA